MKVNGIAKVHTTIEEGWQNEKKKAIEKER